MHLYKTKRGAVLQTNEASYLFLCEWDELISHDNLHSFLQQECATATKLEPHDAQNLIATELLPPIGTQEVWAAGVTYMRSREARMDESKNSGAADCYDRVYAAERPELFFKSFPHRVAGHGGTVNIRKDSTWNVPEPELTLFINSRGSIQAYTIGNDMSSRSIEGENPLYLPQAKVYEKSAALGPCLLILPEMISLDTQIHMRIYRGKEKLYTDSTPISRIKRSLGELAEYLCREYDLPVGAFLMTGTCLVPPNDFTLQVNDTIEISIDNIGTLVNTVAIKK